jgi:hypothetical protein
MEKGGYQWMGKAMAKESQGTQATPSVAPLPFSINAIKSKEGPGVRFFFLD